MNLYSNYKPSGIDWIGDIPSHWELKKLKYTAVINPSKGNSDFNKDSDESVVFLPMERVSEDGQIDCELRKPISEVWNGFTYFEIDDVLVAKITPCFENGKGALLNNLSTQVGFGSTEFHVMRAKAGVLPEFLYLLTRTSPFKNIGEGSMTGAAGQKRVPTEFLENYPSPLPPLPEQSAIAHYLDEKTAQLDTLIDRKRRLIDLLREEKAALINEAVTKGIDSNAPMKDSGIEWLGEIPAHWEVKKLKYLGIIKYGLGQPPKQKEGGLPLIRATNVNRGKIDENELMFVDPDDIPYDRDPVLKEDDIIVVRSGAYTADSAIIPPKYAGAITGYDMVFRAVDVNAKFIAYCLLSDYVLKNQLQPHSLRAAQPHLNREELGDSLIVKPTITEQERIINHINIENARIEYTINRIEQEIELMQEYRTALISEVVTGKVKVV